MTRNDALIGAFVGALILAPGAALAGHGKAGLWNVSTTMNMATPSIPPEAMEQMKKMGVKMPTARSFASQICMTQAEVDSDKLPTMGKNEMNCTSRVVSRTVSSMTAQTVCTGEMKGTGQMQIRYSGAEHYAGSYSFKGNMSGQPVDTSSSFKGDWVKADCGGVKPFVSKK
jgi:uncharacterized protein DUF3617